MRPLLQAARRLRRAAGLLDTPRYRRALFHGVAAGAHHAALLRELSPSTIVDVGANRGQFLLAALEACPAARIVAIEPQPTALRRLTAWLDREPSADQDRVTVHRLALGDRVGTATLHVSLRDDNSSLLEPTAAQLALFPGTGMRGTMDVPLTRLDALFGPADIGARALLKIDVQGGEAAVIAGAGALLPRFAWVLVECSTRELYRGQLLADAIGERLAAAGFRLLSTHHPVHDDGGRAIQADLLFGQGGP